MIENGIHTASVFFCLIFCHLTTSQKPGVVLTNCALYMLFLSKSSDRKFMKIIDYDNIAFKLRCILKALDPNLTLSGF